MEIDQRRRLSGQTGQPGPHSSSTHTPTHTHARARAHTHTNKVCHFFPVAACPASPPPGGELLVKLHPPSERSYDISGVANMNVFASHVQDKYCNDINSQSEIIKKIHIIIIIIISKLCCFIVNKTRAASWPPLIIYVTYQGRKI